MENDWRGYHKREMWASPVGKKSILQMAGKMDLVLFTMAFQSATSSHRSAPNPPNAIASNIRLSWFGIDSQWFLLIWCWFAMFCGGRYRFSMTFPDLPLWWFGVHPQWSLLIWRGFSIWMVRHRSPMIFPELASICNIWFGLAPILIDFYWFGIDFQCFVAFCQTGKQRFFRIPHSYRQLLGMCPLAKQRCCPPREPQEITGEEHVFEIIRCFIHGPAFRTRTAYGARKLLRNATDLRFSKHNSNAY